MIKTRVLAADGDGLREAAAILRAGGLVAFPTETVYGLGADATNAAAIERLYVAKGRPSTNPVIVHAADLDGARRWAASWPPMAQALADAFWPGPLTLVVESVPAIAPSVRAGGSTVGLRVPDHDVARALLAEAALPIAAPSANRSGLLSPTSSEHVLAQLDGRIDAVIAGGAAPRVGIESTVVDCTGAAPRVLRPGMIDTATIARVVAGVEAKPPDDRSSEGVLRSPGLLDRHYAPRTPLRLATREEMRHAPAVAALLVIGDWPRGGERVRVLPAEPAGYAAGLYAALHELDGLTASAIWVETPPPDAQWLAIHDRLRRAATG